MRIKKSTVGAIIICVCAFCIGVAAHAFAQVREEQNPPHSLTTQKQTRVTNLIANISNRFDALVERLTQITRRIEARTALEATQGVDVVRANQAITEAKGSLADASSKLATIDVDVYATVTSENPLSTWPQIAANLIAIHTDLTAAKTSLQVALNALKNPPQIEKSPVHTSTTSVTTN